jgi:hypothetical protein
MAPSKTLILSVTIVAMLGISVWSVTSYRNK